jgi:hypothetical protein
MNLNSKLQQQTLLNKKLQRLLASSVQQLLDVKSSTDSATKAANDALQVADNAVKPTALNGKADLVHTHTTSDITGLAAVATSGNYSSLSGYPNISSVSNFAATDVALASANTYYNCASVSLTAGTWLLMGTGTLGRTTTTAGNYNLRISTGTTHYASTQQYHASVANNFASLSCNAIITVATTTTIYLQAAGTLTNDIVKATTPNNASAATATGLIGIRIA